MMYIHCGPDGRMDGQTDKERDRKKRREYKPHSPRAGKVGGAGVRGGHVRDGGPGPLRHYRLGKGWWGAGRVEAGGGSVLTQASCGSGVGPGAAGRRAVSNTAPPRMRCH